MKFLYLLILLYSGVNADFVKSEESVKDAEHRLQWQDNRAVEENELLYNEAKAYCKALKLNQNEDWRLPTLLELQTIVDFTRYEPALQRGFHFGLSENYWSSTLYADDESRAWAVNFKNGATEHNRHSYDFYVRCVREDNN